MPIPSTPKMRWFIAVLTPLLLAAVGVVSAGDWLSRKADPDTLQNVPGWNSPNATFWRRSARGSVLTLDDAALHESAEKYRRALARNPLDAQAWEGLAGVASRLSPSGGQQEVLEGWLTAIPHSPNAAWAIANLLLRQGKTAESLPYFQRAAADQPRLRSPLYELSWKILDDPARILNELVPADLDARVAYYYYLTDQLGKIAEAAPLWREIRSRSAEASHGVGMHYVERLAGEGMGEEAAAVWAELFPKAAGVKGNVVTNGDFEETLRDAGLDWKLTRTDGVQIQLDEFQAHSAGKLSQLIGLDVMQQLHWLAAGRDQIVPAPGHPIAARQVKQCACHVVATVEIAEQPGRDAFFDQSFLQNCQFQRHIANLVDMPRATPKQSILPQSPLDLPTGVMALPPCSCAAWCTTSYCGMLLCQSLFTPLGQAEPSGMRSFRDKPARLF